MPDRLATTRRAALGGAGVVILTTTGCDADDLDPRPAVPGPTGTADSERSGPPEDADAALVAEAVAAIEEAAAAVSAARADPRSDPRLTPLADLHLAHLALLDAGDAAPATPTPTPGSTTAPPAPGGGRARRLREVVAAEHVLQQRLAEGALAAGSGNPARVLAAMSAAVAQRVSVLGSSA